MTNNQTPSPQTNALGRFGHHPEPANDFCIEVEAIQGQLFDATHGISKPGTVPVTIKEVRARIEKAMDFRVGGDEIAVAAKQTLRILEREAQKAPPSPNVHQLKKGGSSAFEDHLAPAATSEGVSRGRATNDRDTLCEPISGSPQSNVDVNAKAAEAVERIFTDLRDRRFLKWLFDAQGETNLVVMRAGEDIHAIDLEAQAEIKQAWQAIVAKALTAEDQP